MEEIKLITIIGIIISLIGGFIMIRGISNQSNSEIFSNTVMSWGNPITLKSGLLNKYNQRFGFLIYVIGMVFITIVQFMKSKYIIILKNEILIPIIIIVSVITIILIVKTINFIVQRKWDYELVKTGIELFEECKSKIGTKKWITEDYCKGHKSIFYKFWRDGLKISVIPKRMKVLNLQKRNLK